MADRVDIRRLVLTVAFLDERKQKEFFKRWLTVIRGNTPLIMELFTLIAPFFCPDKVEQWIEKRLREDMSLTPQRIAYECRYYKRLDRRLNPYLLILARKVKKRLYMREKRIGK